MPFEPVSEGNARTSDHGRSRLEQTVNRSNRCSAVRDRRACARAALRDRARGPRTSRSRATGHAKRCRRDSRRGSGRGMGALDTVGPDDGGVPGIRTLLELAPNLSESHSVSQSLTLLAAVTAWTRHRVLSARPLRSPWRSWPAGARPRSSARSGLDRRGAGRWAGTRSGRRGWAGGRMRWRRAGCPRVAPPAG